MKTTLLLAGAALTVSTFAYKFLPFRKPGKQRPFLAVLPKYRKVIASGASDHALAGKLAQHGFEKTKQRGSTTKFRRGSVLGDLSIELSKVDISLTRINENSLEITVQAGWVAAFDTGDHWDLITRLGAELERA